MVNKLETLFEKDDALQLRQDALEIGGQGHYSHVIGNIRTEATYLRYLIKGNIPTAIDDAKIEKAISKQRDLEAYIYYLENYPEFKAQERQGDETIPSAGVYGAEMIAKYNLNPADCELISRVGVTLFYAIKSVQKFKDKLK